MHFPMTNEDDMNSDVDITCSKTINLFSNKKRFIYFISGVPLSIKTTGNSLSNFGSNKCIRYMSNDIKPFSMKTKNSDYLFCQNCHTNI